MILQAHDDNVVTSSVAMIHNFNWLAGPFLESMGAEKSLKTDSKTNVGRL